MLGIRSGDSTPSKTACWPGHQHGSLPTGPGDLAGRRQQHLRLIVTESQQTGCHERRAGPGSTGEGGTCPAFPDADLQGPTVVHAQEVNIGAGREHRMPFESRAPGLERNGVEILNGNNHVRIAHANGSHRQLHTIQLDDPLRKTRSDTASPVGT